MFAVIFILNQGMDKKSLAKVEIGTGSRKVDGPSNFQCIPVDDLKNRRDSHLGHLPGRYLSSRTVVRVRPGEFFSTANNTEDVSRRVPNSDDEAGNLLQSSKAHHWFEGLRTPKKSVRHNVPLSDIDAQRSGMTRNCEQLFSQIMPAFCPVKDESGVDPSYSVRRILKGSGLLNTFGTGYLQKESESIVENRSEDSDLENNCSSPHSQVVNMSKKDQTSSLMSTCFHKSQEGPSTSARDVFGNLTNPRGTAAFDLEEFMKAPFSPAGREIYYPPLDPLYSPTGLRTELLERKPMTVTEYETEFKGSDIPSSDHCNRSQASGKAPSSIQRSACSTSPSPYDSDSPTLLYDTVVLQKTVETELIEYLPSNNGQFSRYTSTLTSPMRSDISGDQSNSNRLKTRNMSRRKRKKRRVCRTHPSERGTRSGYEPSSEEDVSSISGSEIGS